MFIGVHMMMAHKLNTPELEITADEGLAFMAAAQNVLRHYSVEATQKTLDWIALAGIGGGMYLTRGVAISNRLSQEKAERAAMAGTKIIPLRRPGRQPVAGQADPAAPPPAIHTGQPAPDITLDPFSTAGFQGEGEPA